MMYDFIVIGGGVIGMTTARELSMQNCRVLLCDKSELGMESSWAAGGILSSMRPWAEPAASAVLSDLGKREYQLFVEKLANTTGNDAEYNQHGLYMLGTDDVRQTKNWAAKNNVTFSSVREENETPLSLPADSLLLPEIAQVRPSRLIQALKKELQICKVEIVENTSVQAIAIQNNRFYSIKTDKQEIRAGNVVISAGAWSQLFGEQLGINISVKPICGQMLCVQTDNQPFHQIVLDGGHYLIPRRDGHVLIGSSMEETGFNKPTSNEIKEELFAWARIVWPDIDKAKLVRHWAGLRPASKSGIPIIGSVEHVSGVYINTGHFRKGILQAPVSAMLLTQHIMKNKTIVPIEPYAPRQ